MTDHKFRLYCGNRAMPVVLTGLLLLTLALHPLRVVAMDTIHLIVPAWRLTHMQRVFEPLASKLYLDEHIELRWTAVEYDARRLLNTTKSVQESGSGAILWFGWAQTFAGELYTEFAAELQPDELTYSSKFDTVGDVPRGLIALGAGWHSGDPDAPVILSLPRRKATLPIQSMAVIRQSYSGGDRQAAKSVEEFTGFLFRSHTGQQALRALTVLPAISEREFLPDSDTVDIVFQPRSSRDGCGCDDESAPFSTCDPDGSVLRTMSGLEQWGNRAIAPGYGVGYGAAEGDCDPCADAAAVWFGDPYAPALVKQIGERLRDSRGYTNWLDQHRWLEKMHADGNIVLVAACDPD